MIFSEPNKRHSRRSAPREKLWFIARHVTVTMVSFATLLEVLSRICRGFGTYTWLRMGRSRTISISPFRGFHKCHILISFRSEERRVGKDVRYCYGMDVSID